MIQFSFLDPKRVQDIQRKCERMLNFYTYEFVAPDSKENTTIPSAMYEDTKTLNKMNELKGVLGKLSMFYAYNTNWGNRNPSDYSKTDSKVVSKTFKTGLPQKNALEKTGTYVFHLSMPYTMEVNNANTFICLNVFHHTNPMTSNKIWIAIFLFFRRNYGLRNNLIF